MLRITSSGSLPRIQFAECDLVDQASLGTHGAFAICPFNLTPCRAREYIS